MMLILRQALLAAAAVLLLSSPAFAGATDATCTVTFDAIWSAETHPIDFPASAHFSGLIGGTHNQSVVFWEGGLLATPGIQSMAETGSKTLFQGEVEDAIFAGTAGEVISGGSIPVSPGSASASFDISLDFPLATVVSMIAPSPDWFVGVHGLPLFEQGGWVSQKVVELPPYDAGTDSGASFTSPNQPTIPAMPIFTINDSPFPSGESLGTFTFDCVGPLVFTDGFESGDLSAWTQSVP